jgi:hypothetical protein
MIDPLEDANLRISFLIAAQLTCARIFDDGCFIAISRYLEWTLKAQCAGCPT